VAWAWLGTTVPRCDTDAQTRSATRWRDMDGKEAKPRTRARPPPDPITSWSCEVRQRMGQESVSPGGRRRPSCLHLKSYLPTLFFSNVLGLKRMIYDPDLERHPKSCIGARVLDGRFHAWVHMDGGGVRGPPPGKPEWEQSCESLSSSAANKLPPCQLSRVATNTPAGIENMTS
jgi:hypothetical protein